MNKYDKGQYGYLDAYKKNKLILTIIFALMIIFIVVTMVIMFGDTKRVGIVFAILLSLPFAKLFIAYIIAAKYKQINKAMADDILSAAGGDNYILFDILLSKYEGIKHYSALCVKNGRIYALVLEKDYEKCKKEYTKWIEECTTDSKYKYSVNIFSDENDYIKKLKAVSEPNDNTKLIDRHIRERITDSSV